MAKPKAKRPEKRLIQTYKCGLVGGQKLRLIRGYKVLYPDGTFTGKRHVTGEIWTVLFRLGRDKTIVWLRDAKGNPCTWDDDPSIFEKFELVT